MSREGSAAVDSNSKLLKSSVGEESHKLFTNVARRNATHSNTPKKRKNLLNDLRILSAPVKIQRNKIHGRIVHSPKVQINPNAKDEGKKSFTQIFLILLLRNY
jgi:hypothetical protein